ncbi:MAG: DUF948 domain-containing protein [Deltaproteobacteria bacterium]|nr:DUF948 domain-containing protein [Deltaproteobacteria bacterium]
MYLEISVVILSVAFLLIAALSIPLLIQIWRTAKSITATLNLLNQSLPGILKNLDEITANINKATYAANNQIESISLVVRRVQGVLELFLDFEQILRESLRLPFFKTIKTATAALKGVRVFLDVFRSSR